MTNSSCSLIQEEEPQEVERRNQEGIEDNEKTPYPSTHRASLKLERGQSAYIFKCLTA